MIVVLSVLLFGCAAHDGTYTPDCIAYEGSSISLSDGRFVWEKFSDSVAVDDIGRVIKQYPAYPLRGSFRIDGQTLFLTTTAGESLSRLYFQQHNERQYLLTTEQFEMWKISHKFDTCALVLGGYANKK